MMDLGMDLGTDLGMDPKRSNKSHYDLATRLSHFGFSHGIVFVILLFLNCQIVIFETRRAEMIP